jgi:hypothetical protein
MVQFLRALRWHRVISGHVRDDAASDLYPDTKSTARRWTVVADPLDSGLPTTSIHEQGF